MQDLVKYHNDFNQIYLGKLNEGELNLAFDIISRVKEKGTEPIYFSAEDLKSHLPKKYSLHEFSNLIISLRRKFFKLDFTILLDVPNQPNLQEERIINLFHRLSIFRNRDTNEVDHVIIQVDEFFQYLVNGLKANFTRFELEELFQIRGSYAKNLYRLLKQYRHTGSMTMSWEEFSKQMNIPKKYTQELVNRKILRPAVAELSENRIVDGVNRPTFKKLKFKKLNSPGSKKITAIEFTFETEEKINKKQQDKVQDTCPFAEGSLMWYVWHHKVPPVEEIPNSSVDPKLIEHLNKHR